VYHYWECPRCHARTATQSQTAGAYASPLCQNPPCRRATMAHIGQGEAPFAPPPAPAPGAPPALNNADVVFDQGHDTHHGRALDWTVYCNTAKAEVRLLWTVGGSNQREARLHLSMLKQNAASAEESRIFPPFTTPGRHRACWLWLPSRGEPLQNIGTFHTIGWASTPPPPAFEIRMRLGTGRWGLIHLLVGHADDMRGWMGTANPTQNAGDQGYRTVQGVQRGLMERLAVGQLKQIRRDIGDKWLFIGKDGACLVATQAAGKSYLTVTTFYKSAGQVGGSSAIYWQRKGKF